MLRIVLFFISFTLAVSSVAGQAPTGLRCEWRVNPTDVRDPHPELYWEMASQNAYQVRGARSPADLVDGRDLVWDSGRVETKLPIAEYAGPELPNATTFWWHVRVWDAEGRAVPDAPAQTFRMNVQAMPHHLPTIRTFMNFGGDAQFARDWLDLSFRKQSKSLRESVLATRYGLICTLVLPHPSMGEPLSGKAKALADFCVEKGLTKEGILEEMFCHFSEGTYVTLHVGAERAANPREKRKCPGWDPANDRNGDNRVGDDEAVRLANTKATARQPSQTRIPIYFWGPPRDDFVMNVGHPAYQEFMATVWSPQICERHDGIYFDTVLTERIVNSRCTTRRETHPETSCSNRRAVPCRRAFGGQLCSGSLRSPPQSRPPNQGNACPKASPYSKPFLV